MTRRDLREELAEDKLMKGKPDLRSIPVACASTFIFLFCAPQASGTDWPMYRADSARSGYTSEELPEKLELQWTYRSPHPPQPAWPDREWQHMPFDYAYQVVVANGTVYYGSSADCKVYALDAATGEERWSFYTDGPVRFAPAVWKDRVFVVSDDGFLYCLGAKDGKLLWRLRGGPAEWKVLGNGRMVSMWPARGGVVIEGGTVYFGAGIFPTQGFFLYAVDAESGRTQWVNDTAGNMRLYQYNHGFAYTNVAAQGYLTVAGDTLLVSTGRGVPAAFSRADGRFLYHNPLEVYRTGGAWVMAADRYVFNDDMAFHLESGAVACPKVGSALTAKERTVEAAATPELILVANGKTVRAIDRRRPFVGDPAVFQRFKDRRYFFAGTPRRRLSKKLQGPNVLWSAPVDCSGTLIAAGSRAYAGGQGRVAALDLKTRQVVWTAKVEGTVYGLAAADGRLYASTDRGLIHCFGGPGGRAKVVERRVNEEPYSDNALYARAAEEIIKMSGTTEGYCLDLGCGDGRLSYELARRTRLQIYAADGDEKKVAAARKALDSAGMYGTRVTFHHLDPQRTGYPVYFANLIVSGRSVTEGPSAVPEPEMKRLQRPCGGVTLIGKVGSMKKTVRGRVEGSGIWSHQTGTPANTCSSEETAVRGPLGVLWFGTSGPGGMCGSKARSIAPLFIDGRLYIAGTNFLRCLDAYNGRVMWEIGGYRNRVGRYYLGANLLGSNVCASEEHLYVVRNNRECLRLDGRTGQQLAAFPAPAGPDGKPGTWGYLAYADGILYGTVESGKLAVCFEDYLRPLRSEVRLFESKYHKYTEGVSLFGMDAETGKLEWMYKAKDLIPHNAIAIGGGRVYLIDRPNLSVEVAKARRRGAPAPPSTAGGSLVALDARTGREIWRNDEDIFGTLLALSVEHRALVVGFPIMRRGNFVSDLFTRRAVHRASDGRRLWDAPSQYHQRPLIVGRTVIVDPGGFNWRTGRKHIPLNVPSAWDLLTGQPKLRENPVTGEPEFWTFGRTEKCSGWTACPNLLLFRTATISYYDLLRDEGVANVGGIRPGCFINVIPAGGIVLAPDNFTGCTCNYIHRTSIALQPLEQKEHWALFNGNSPRPGTIKHLALNIGGIGDRRDRNGTLWLAAPRPLMQKTAGVKVDARAFVFDRNGVTIQLGEKPRKSRRDRPWDRPPTTWPCGYSDTERPASVYNLNAERAAIIGADTPWVFASGNRGPTRVGVNISRMPANTRYRVRLYFAEVEDKKPGERVFDVLIGEKAVLRSFDVVREAGKKHVAVVKELEATGAEGSLTISLIRKKGEPILSGLEVKAIGD